MSSRQPKLERLVQALVEEEVITGIGQPIKSGKEASVYRCFAPPSGDGGDLALKLFRDSTHRNFRNDAAYREGSRALRKGGGDTREARALHKHSAFGRRYAEKTWVEHEWWVLNRLWDHGLPVPEPVRLMDNAILMELFTTVAGEPAPGLYSAKLSNEDAAYLSSSLARDVEEMLDLDLVHGDLSQYNVLWNGTDYRIIDFPQAVDARFNPNAWDFLVRDLTTLGDFFQRFGVVPDANVLAHKLWSKYTISRGTEPPGRRT